MRQRGASRLVVALVAGALSALLTACAGLAGVSDAATQTVGGAVRPTQAQTIAAKVIGESERAAAAPGPEGDALRAEAYTGDALVAATADAKLAATLSAQVRGARTSATSPPVVLAVSRGPSYPRSMLLQTTRAQSGLPVLHLLSTPDVRTPYRIAASTPMLPSASVRAFEPVTQGSTALGDGSGLVRRPEELAQAYAASLAFPAPAPAADRPFAPDTFAAGVAAGASSQNQDLGGVGTFAQQHEAKDITGGLRVRGNAGALVFAVLDRTDTLLNKTPGTLKPSAPFTALTGLSTVKAEAQLRTLEFVAFLVPDAGQVVVVGADEHLYAASGT